MVAPSRMLYLSVLNALRLGTENGCAQYQKKLDAQGQAEACREFGKDSGGQVSDDAQARLRGVGRPRPSPLVQRQPLPM